MRSINLVEDYEVVKAIAEIQNSVKNIMRDFIPRTDKTLSELSNTLKGLDTRMNAIDNLTIEQRTLFQEHVKSISSFKERIEKQVEANTVKLDRHDKFIDQLSSMPLVWKGITAMLGAIATILGIIAYTK